LALFDSLLEGEREKNRYSMKKVLMVHRDFNEPGGGNTVALWILEALKSQCDLTLLAWQPPDLPANNRFYQTSLQGSELSVRVAPVFLRRLAGLDPHPFSTQARSWLMRLAKRVSRHYDVVISAEDEFDLGCRSIQYIHYPWLAAHLSRFSTKRECSPLERWQCLVNYRYRPWRLISGFSFERMRNNLTLVNSDWTGRRVWELCGIEAKTVYPPVPGSFADVPWDSRENGFVSVGRIAPEKELRKVMDIVAGVRAGGHDVHLHIVGTVGSRRHDRLYSQQVSQWAAERASWVSLHLDFPREELLHLISKHRYGIHGMSAEPFGIAVAELVVGGCIVFVPNDGGQTEIVGGHPRLLYRTVDEAVAKITAVMSSRQEQEALRHHLHAGKELFSTERFMREIKEIVRTFK
jgi:glycosyltransferase involved in cell wall biosynthesis